MGKAVLFGVIVIAAVVVFLSFSIMSVRQRYRAATQVADRRVREARDIWLGMRTTNALREEAYDRLAQARADGQLTPAEHETRVAAIHASVTNAQVMAQLDGLDVKDARLYGWDDAR